MEKICDPKIFCLPNNYLSMGTQPLNPVSQCIQNDKDLSPAKSAPFKTTTFGGALYSCVVCRQKKVKCDGERPKCRNCSKFDRMCNYEETSYSEDLTQDLDYIQKKLADVNLKIHNLQESAKSQSEPNSNIDAFNATLASVLVEKLDFSKSNSKASLLNERPSDNINPDSVIDRAALEFGCPNISNDLLLETMEKAFKGTVLSFTVSRTQFINKLQNNLVPDSLKYAILAYGSKLFDEHVVYHDHLYMCGSSYADKAYKLITSDRDPPSADKILAMVILANHYFGLSDSTKAVCLVNMATKKALFLRLNSIDTVKQKEFLLATEWEETEYKRRVWWFVYITRIMLNFIIGSSNWIDSKDICVNLPSNDTYFCKSDKVDYICTQNLKEMDYEARDKYDTFWLIIKIYVELDLVSSFVNRKGSDRSRNKIKSSPHFSHLNKRLDNYHQLYKTHFGEFDSNERSFGFGNFVDKNELTSKCFSYFYCGLLYRLSRLILHQSETVLYSLDPAHLIRVKEAKGVCIEMAIQIAYLTKLSDDFFFFSRYCISSCYSNYCAGSILLNALKLYDHEDYNIIKESYQNVFLVLKKTGLFMKIACEFEKALRSNYNIFMKSVTANSKYLDRFPELKITRLTKKDSQIWFVILGTSGMNFMCCSVSSDCPKYKYVFIEGWYNTEIMQTRDPSFIKSIDRLENISYDDIISASNGFPTASNLNATGYHLGSQNNPMLSCRQPIRMIEEFNMNSANMFLAKKTNYIQKLKDIKPSTCKPIQVKPDLVDSLEASSPKRIKSDNDFVSFSVNTPSVSPQTGSLDDGLSPNFMYSSRSPSSSSSLSQQIPNSILPTLFPLDIDNELSYSNIKGKCGPYQF
ncbi:hypothetical protein AYI68_g8255 [Smittium mucronatum]|uniref:Zn(2)-C6 fungal-type domain-containing protein n=1 Tax=Smittium mucronatum TaxID=133383 RepID=A0A1R0GLE7_9FUNG|nr:hypothetical protein AYI68_g8255 [Smittium mucronatum]